MELAVGTRSYMGIFDYMGAYICHTAVEQMTAGKDRQWERGN